MLPGSQTGLTHMPLTVTTAAGPHRFDVEIAQTAEQQEIGMMFRKNIPADSGMLFPYTPAQPVAFWMKNTLVPLDLIFIGEDHRILNIAADAVPLSLEPIPSSGPVVGVLEIAGGRAAALGMQPGDRVDW